MHNFLLFTEKTHSDCKTPLISTQQITNLKDFIISYGMENKQGF